MGCRGTRVWVWMTVALLTAGCGSANVERSAEVASESASASGQRFGRTGEWVRLPAGPLSSRHEANGVWVAGRFIVLGGWSSPMCPPNADCPGPEEPALRNGAAFDPATGQWTRIADAPVPISGLNMVAVGGQVYVLTAEHGRADSPVTFLSYDPGRDRWTTLPRPPVWGTLVAAGSSVVAVPGSDEQGDVIDSVFNVKSAKWKPLPNDPLGPSFDREAVWVDGGLLLASKDLVPNPGAEGPAVVRLARLDGNFSQWSTLPDSEIIGWGPLAVGSRVVWPGTGSADGGKVGNWGRSYAEGGVLDPSSGAWLTLPTLPWKPALWNPAAGCCETVVGDQALVGGHLLEPATLRWTRVPKLPGDERAAATVVGGADALFVWGGSTFDDRPENLNTGYLLGPSAPSTK